jgi:hypothetical protein
MADLDGFSLTNCGPLDRALARAGLGSGAPPRLFVRAFLPAVVIWAPLLALSFLRPDDGAGAEVSFMQDLATHVRFLIVVPVLVLVEFVIGRRTRLVAGQFARADLIDPVDRVRFEALLGRTGRWLQSNAAEAVIALVAALFVVSAMREFARDEVVFWFEVPAADGTTGLTAAGWWYAIGSWVPPFLLLRWMWRYGVWCWLLWRISRFELNATATHPDRAGGLGFIAMGHTAFSGVGFAVSCLVAGAIGTRILNEGASLVTFQWPIAAFVALSIAVGIAPLAVFWRPLRRSKEAGLLTYGAFAARFVRAFDSTWVGEGSKQDPLSARDDIGPLADIGQAYERVAAMRPVPISLVTALAFAAASLAPMLPLLLTVMPLKDLLKLLLQAMI